MSDLLELLQKSLNHVMSVEAEKNALFNDLMSGKATSSEYTRALNQWAEAKYLHERFKRYVDANLKPYIAKVTQCGGSPGSSIIDIIGRYSTEEEARDAIAKYVAPLNADVAFSFEVLIP